MANRLITVVISTDGTQSCKVYKDAAYQEYVVRLFRSNKVVAGADYFTDNKEDALRTARTMADEANPDNIIIKAVCHA